MGFAIIQRTNDMGLWLEQDITEEKFDTIVNDIANGDGQLDHEWGKFYDEDGLLVKGVSFDGGQGHMTLMKFNRNTVSSRRTTTASLEIQIQSGRLYE